MDGSMLVKVLEDCKNLDEVHNIPSILKTVVENECKETIRQVLDSFKQDYPRIDSPPYHNAQRLKETSETRKKLAIARAKERLKQVCGDIQ